MKKKILAVLSFVLLISVTLISITGCGPKSVESGDTVQVHYTVMLEDGEVVDSSLEGEPLEVTLGQNQVIPGFEQALLDMKVGDNKTVTVPADQAYGRYIDELVMVVGKDELPEGLEVEVGMQLQAVQPDGSVLLFEVTEIGEETITVDGNHPLAGHELTFNIELVEILVKKSNSGTSLTSMTLSEALSNGKITFAEFGSDTCAPCRQMKPIIEDLAVLYEGKVNVLIIDVYEYRDLTNQYGIVGIPTQILFDSYGREVTRHTGFWAKDDIIAQLKEMGIE